MSLLKRFAFFVFFVYSVCTVILPFLFGEFFMFFSKEQVSLLDVSLKTQLGVFRRRFNSESSPAIREILAQQIADVNTVIDLIYNPKLLVK